MNINFHIFMRLESIWLFFIFIIYYFVAIFRSFRFANIKLFFFQKFGVIDDRSYNPQRDGSFEKYLKNINFLQKEVNEQFEKRYNRPVTKYWPKSHVSQFISINIANIRFLINLLLLYFLCFNYMFAKSYIRLYESFQLFNYCWVYDNFIIVFFFIYLFILYYSYSANYLKNPEHLFGIFFLFLNLHYFVLVNNLVTIVFLFELQSIIFLYYIALLHYNYLGYSYFSNKTNPNLQSFNFQWYINSLFFQFWISFVGVIFFMYGIFYIYRLTGFLDWSNLNLFFFLFKHSWSMLSNIDCLLVWLIFFIGLLLKIGFFPFFLWKPEIYKNFNIFVLFFYMFIYLFFILFFLFFFFNSYIITARFIWYVYIYYIYTIATIFLLFYLHAIHDIRSFLAYSSALNLCYLLIVLTIYSYTGFTLFLFYLFIYSFYIFNFFAFLFLISNNFLWFFTDLQYLGNFVFLMSFFFSFFFGLAGIPPFFGFFAKIGVVSILLYNEHYFFFFLSLFTGLFATYFYLQIYRFSGFSIKSIYYFNRVTTFKFSGFFLYLNYFLLMINFSSFFFLSDIYIFSYWLALQL